MAKNKTSRPPKGNVKASDMVSARKPSSLAGRVNKDSGRIIRKSFERYSAAMKRLAKA